MSMRSKSRSGDPRRHPFLETHNPGIAAVAAGGGGFPLGHSVGAVVVTSAHLRETRCGVPGCGRPRHDPIHDVDGEDEVSDRR
jgi:hypothetical protein